MRSGDGGYWEWGGRAGDSFKHSRIFVNLHSLGILLNLRDVVVFNLIASAARDAEDEFVERGAAEDVDVVA
jgi:hypothetical protein